MRGGELLAKVVDSELATGDAFEDIDTVQLHLLVDLFHLFENDY